MAKNIEPTLKLISKYLKLDKSENFVIPEYQRGYAWDITQCDKLWQDIEAFIASNASDPYFFGTIIVDCSVTNKFSLIDGQQRTTILPPNERTSAARRRRRRAVRHQRALCDGARRRTTVRCANALCETWLLWSIPKLDARTSNKHTRRFDIDVDIDA